MEKPTESSEEESDDELSESEESDGESSDNFGSDSDGKKFRHECETDGLSLSLSLDNKDTEAEQQDEANSGDRESRIGVLGSLDGMGEIQIVTEVEYILGRASASKIFPRLARADSAGVEKFVRQAINNGVQYKVKWQGAKAFVIADAHQSFVLQIANFELGFKFRDAQIVKSDNDRARYCAAGGTEHSAVGEAKRTSKRKRK